MGFTKLLCVCTGNICRSPLAEGWLRKALPQAEVGSAGIAAVEGGSMPDEAQTIADREALPLAGHRGRQLTTPIMRHSELVLVMEKGQLDWITANFPESRGRVFLLSHWIDGVDIDDPYRHDAAYFERVYGEIVRGAESWVAKLGRIG